MRIRNDILVLLAILFCVASVSGPSAQTLSYQCDQADPNRAYFDPCVSTNQAEVKLPLPLNLEMVFVAVPVPGAKFWHDPRRQVRMGNPDRPIYQGARLVNVSGTFPNANADGWDIFIGKYEVTVAQYIAVMGQGDPGAGIDILIEASKSDTSGAPLPEYEDLRTSLDKPSSRLTLATPVRGISGADYETFLNTLIVWCNVTPECLAQMPRLDGYPGQVRFPTEIEWEFTARGGYDERRETAFDWIAPIPFPADEAQNYAHVAPFSDRKPAIIGQYLPVAGVYDLFGNVRELLSDRFSAEPGHGRVGDRVLRGPGFRTDSKQLHAGLRSEFLDWRLSEDGPMIRSKPSDVGIRLALGAPVTATQDFEEKLVGEYSEYIATTRIDSTAAKVSAPGVTRAAEQLGLLSDIADSLRSQSGNDRIADLIDDEIASIANILDQEAQKNTVALVKEAIIVAANTRRSFLLKLRQEEFIEANADLAKSNSELKPRLDRATQRVEDYQTQITAGAKQYAQKVIEISEYQAYVHDAFDVAQSFSFTEAEKIAFELVNRHTKKYLIGEGGLETWFQDLTAAIE